MVSLFGRGFNSLQLHKKGPLGPFCLFLRWHDRFFDQRTIDIDGVATGVDDTVNFIGVVVRGHWSIAGLEHEYSTEAQQSKGDRKQFSEHSV